MKVPAIEKCNDCPFLEQHSGSFSTIVLECRKLNRVLFQTEMKFEKGTLWQLFPPDIEIPPDCPLPDFVKEQ